MTRPAISVENLSVRFRPYVDKKPTMRRTLATFRHREVEEVTAVDDVSFEVHRGEAFGIVGRNGAGKSTLLRVLAGTLRPDSGKVVVNGRASTLLQLGVGFNHQLSGRRNIYLGGLAGGLRKAQIDEMFDDIVEYAGLEEAIDRPVKTYSSGMFSRLAFSVGMHLDPEILFLDEVLSVGDQAFREKSMKAMEDLLERAGTIIFVSHSLESVADFCDRAMWMDRGKIVQIGEAAEVVSEYGRESRRRARRQARAEAARAGKSGQEAGQARGGQGKAGQGQGGQGKGGQGGQRQGGQGKAGQRQAGQNKGGQGKPGQGQGGQGKAGQNKGGQGKPGQGQGGQGRRQGRRGRAVRARRARTRRAKARRVRTRRVKARRVRTRGVRARASPARARLVSTANALPTRRRPPKSGLTSTALPRTTPCDSLPVG